MEIEVIGTYRNGDAEYVRAQLEAILPDKSRNSGCGASGNRFTYETSSVVDVESLAEQIHFDSQSHDDRRRGSRPHRVVS